MPRFGHHYILLLFAISFLLFQNCGGPQDISEQNQSLSSQKLHEELQVLRGESISLSPPLAEVISNPDFNWTQVEVSWLWITPTGQRFPLGYESLTLDLHEVDRRDAGTYRATVDHQGRQYIFNYRIRVVESYALNSDQRGSYQHEYVNTPCQQGLDRRHMSAENIRFSQAQEACLEAQSAPSEERQGRGLICRFDGVAFHASPSTFPRDKFLAQQRPNFSNRYQDIFQVEDVSQCTARIECRDFIDLQMRTGNASSPSVIRCYWGDSLVSPIE